MTTILPSGWWKRRKEPPVVVNIHVTTDVDPRKIVAAVRREMRAYEGRRGLVSMGVPPPVPSSHSPGGPPADYEG